MQIPPQVRSWPMCGRHLDQGSSIASRWGRDRICLVHLKSLHNKKEKEMNRKLEFSVFIIIFLKVKQICLFIFLGVN